MKWYSTFAQHAAEAELKAEERAKRRANGELQLTLPKPRFVYHPEYLEKGRQLEIILGRPILNPRNIEAVSLLEIDPLWMTDMATHRETIQFHLDYPKRPAALK